MITPFPRRLIYTVCLRSNVSIASSLLVAASRSPDCVHEEGHESQRTLCELSDQLPITLASPTRHRCSMTNAFLFHRIKCRVIAICIDSTHTNGDCLPALEL